MYRKYEPDTGEDLPTTAERMIAVAKASGNLVRTQFGDSDLVATATSKPEEVIAQFNCKTHKPPTNK